jgi:Helix-turn-helix domain
MTTLTSAQIVKAQTLRTAGTSLRAIARTLRVAHSTLKRALDQQADGSTQSTIERLRLARLQKLQHQNDRLHIELQKLKESWVPRDIFEAEVVRANIAVKLQFLSLGVRLAPDLAPMTDIRAIGRRLTEEMTKICNDLAFENYRAPGYCPTCGRKEESA